MTRSDARRQPAIWIDRIGVRFVGALVLACAASGAIALYDPAKEYVEAPAVAARYPDPPVTLTTPAFKAGREDFTSQEEMLAFVQDLSRRSPDLRVRIAGRSQEKRAIPLLIFARPAASAGAELLKNGKPTILIIGQQHGNEPAGGEAALALALQLATTDRARMLDRVNVLLVPRANPDGAHHFVRGLADGNDVNRDHLLEVTPEGQALGQVAVEFQPDVVLDCHEFGVKTRWFEKFQSLQGYDALIQYATVSNLPPALTDTAERMFRAPLVQALEAAALRQSWYYASSYDMRDLKVSMGGVVPDTGRNIAGLRNAISFLIETRGVGIGRAHYKRRVYTHLVAMNAFIDSAAANADALPANLRTVRREVAASAGAGDLVVLGVATPARHTLDMIDPQTGADKHVEVDWRSALSIDVKLKRPRPYGYLMPVGEIVAARHLQGLGVTVLRVTETAPLEVERYRIVSMEETKKEDVRRNDEEGGARVVRLATATEPARITVHEGDFYVPMDQPLANVIGAALEPDTQSSYAANHLLTLPALSASGGNTATLPLYRVAVRLPIATVAWNGEQGGLPYSARAY